MIDLDLRTTISTNALDEGKRDIVSALSKLYGTGSQDQDKVDFNNVGPSTIADHLIAADPLLIASKGTDAATQRYQALAQAMVDYRNNPQHSGLIASFNDLKAGAGRHSRGGGSLSAMTSTFPVTLYLILKPCRA